METTGRETSLDVSHVDVFLHGCCSSLVRSLEKYMSKAVKSCCPATILHYM